MKYLLKNHYPNQQWFTRKKRTYKVIMNKPFFVIIKISCVYLLQAITNCYNCYDVAD